MKQRFILLLISLCAACAVLGCDAQNLPQTPIVASPTLGATATAQPTETLAAPPATDTPNLVPFTETPTAAPATETPADTATPEQTATATEEPPTAVPAETDTPDTSAQASTRTPTHIRPTRTATADTGSTPGTAESTPEAQPTKGAAGTAEAAPTGAWREVVRGVPGQKRIAITFDAGASGETWPRVLQALRDRGLHITMFITGKFAEQYPDAIKQAVADGDEIGNHTYSHLDSRQLTDAQLSEELAHTEQIIHDLTGITTKPYWRAPYGARNNHVLNVAVSQGYRSIYWTLDSLDSVGQPKTPDFIFNRITNPPGGLNLDGAITLQHFGSEASAEALPRELDRLKEMGYQVVTISQLLAP